MERATFHINYCDAGSMHLAQAILIYHRGRPPTRHVYASVHDVELVGNDARLLAGHPATLRALVQLNRDLRGTTCDTEFIPEQALYNDGETLVWWTKSAHRHVTFRTGEPIIGSRGASVPHPPLVFLATSKAWRVWALAASGRPTPDSPLFQAPYFNVSANRAICAGNVALPRHVRYTAIGDWEDAFFRSTFTHPNTHGPNSLVRDRRGAHAFWRAMLDQTYAEFPTQVLVPTNRCLGDVLSE